MFVTLQVSGKMSFRICNGYFELGSTIVNLIEFVLNRFTRWMRNTVFELLYLLISVLDWYTNISYYHPYGIIFKRLVKDLIFFHGSPHNDSLSVNLNVLRGTLRCFRSFTAPPFRSGLTPILTPHVILTVTSFMLYMLHIYIILQNMTKHFVIFIFYPPNWTKNMEKLRFPFSFAFFHHFVFFKYKFFSQEKIEIFK